MDNIKQWIENETTFKGYKLTPASEDASFRKYYRLSNDENSFILMDASLEKESLQPFVDIAQRLHRVNLSAPFIYAQNLQEGYLILEDFGQDNLLDLLTLNNFKSYYTKAIESIVSMQEADTTDLPLYDNAFLLQEMSLMQEWFLEKKLHIELSKNEQNIIHTTLHHIVSIVLEQPQNIFVHRDFHSRNIMVTKEGRLGVIDFQDAMSGAITYDLVSLLKDCYISFEREEIIKLALLFRDKKGLKVDDAAFIKWFDFMGMQRHIKVLGVFSRLYLRDKKDAYLQDIPLTLSYTLEALHRYDETKELAQLLEDLTS